MKTVYQLILVAYFSTITYQTMTVEFSAIYKNYTMFKSIQLGTPPVSIYSCIDTLATKSWIRTSGCADCSGGLTTYSCLGTCISSADEVVEHLNSIELKGLLLTDHIDFTSFNLDQVPFIGVTSEKYGTVSAEGSIALGLANYDSDDTHIIKKLVTAGTIDKAIVGIHLSSNEESSQVMLGAYDSTLVKDIKKLVWFDVSDTWEFGVSSINVGSYKSGSAKIKINYAMSCITVPQDSYNAVVSQVNKKSMCFGGECTITLGSMLSMPTIKIQVTSKLKWDIDYRYYLVEIRRYSVITYCDSDGCHYTTYVVYDLTLAKGDSWVLGSEGLQHFYSVLDYDNKKLGMYYFGLPLNKQKLIYIIVFTILGAIFIGVGVAIIVIRRRRYRRC